MAAKTSENHTVQLPVSLTLDTSGAEGPTEHARVGEGRARLDVEAPVTPPRSIQASKIADKATPLPDFAELAGIGPVLAARIRDTLKVHTLEQLELAAHTGRLKTVAGVGAGRSRYIRQQLQERFKSARGPASSSASPLKTAPPVADLLWIDHEYRVKAKVGVLTRVAPKRLNPTGAAWLPILRTTLGATSYTAFFSNTEAAHRAGKTHSWVIVLAECGGRANQYTVVSETRGSWRGQRVVRGREDECREYYQSWAA